ADSATAARAASVTGETSGAERPSGAAGASAIVGAPSKSALGAGTVAHGGASGGPSGAGPAGVGQPSRQPPDQACSAHAGRLRAALSGGRATASGSRDDPHRSIVPHSCPVTPRNAQRGAMAALSG